MWRLARTADRWSRTADTGAAVGRAPPAGWQARRFRIRRTQLIGCNLRDVRARQVFCRERPRPRARGSGIDVYGATLNWETCMPTTIGAIESWKGMQQKFCEMRWPCLRKLVLP